jgi:hypothetical protein
MSDTEKEKFRQIGTDLINEYRERGGLSPITFLPIHTPEVSAFIRSIQLHENTKKELQDVKQEFADFKQKVSDAVRDYYGGGYVPADSRFAQFIIPAPKPDPLLAALLELELSSDLQEGQHDAKWIRNKLDELGFEIREKNDGER